VIALVLLVWGMIELGVPWAANRLVHAISPGVDESISEQTLAVLAHEIGHVVGRHGLRSVLQDSVVVLLIGSITGDILSTNSLASALPVVLVETRFSREFEGEADRFALDLMRREKIPPRRFHDLLSRIEEAAGGDGGSPGFFSTHPAAEERVRLFQ